MRIVLPINLLIAKTRGSTIFPRYSMFKDHEIFIADELIYTFKEHIGYRKGELKKRLKEIEEEAFRLGCDYRFARALIHILLRKAEFQRPTTRVDPLRMRLELFSEVTKMFKGSVLDEEERKQVLECIAEKYKLDPSEVLRIIRSIHEEEEILKGFSDIEASDLLKEYNLALTQTLLFKALDIIVDLRATGTCAKIILFNVKRMGLMYTAERLDHDIRLYIDGPISAIKQTERYGTRLAKVLPYLIMAERWKIRAKVRRRGRVYNFFLTDRFSYLFPRVELKYLEYDSDVERTFYKRFQTLGSGWTIKREPEPLVVGKSILIPDFSFTKDGNTVYLEIVGFWTKEYLERKIKKLKKLRNVNMIVAVDEKLSCSKLQEIPFKDIILYKGRLPAVEVYLKLREYEHETKKEEKHTKARRKGKIRIIPEIHSYLESIKMDKLANIIASLEKFGMSKEEVINLLEEKGFIIEWKSMDPKEIVVRAPTKREEQTPSN